VTENREETKLEIGPGKLRALVAGCKMYTIRRGHRTFAKNISVSSGGGAGITCIVNSYVHTILSEVSFDILATEGFHNFAEALQILRVFYPEMAWDSPVTIVEFRTAL